MKWGFRCRSARITRPGSVSEGVNRSERIVVLGSVAGPVDGQRRLTKTFRDSTRFRTTTLDFNLHRHMLGPFVLATQFIIAVSIALRGQVDVCYLASSRSRFGMFRDFLLFYPFWLTRVPIVAHIHGAEFGEFFLVDPSLGGLKRKYLLCLSRIILIHEAFLPDISWVHDKSVVVRNPIPKFAAAAARETSIRAREQAIVTFGFISSFVPGKGLEAFLRVANIFSSRAKFLVAGGVNRGFAAYGKSAVAKVRAQGSVEYMGYLKNPESFYGRCDYVIFPTYYASEAVPGVVIEALTFGCVPIVLARRTLVQVFDGAPIIWLSDISDLEGVMGRELSQGETVRIARDSLGPKWVAGQFPSETRWVDSVDEVLLDSLGMVENGK